MRSSVVAWWRPLVHPAVEVTAFIAENATLTFDPRTGMQGGKGMTSNGQWWIENVIEECDDANEYFFDVRTRKLYNPNSTSAGPLGWRVGSRRACSSTYQLRKPARARRDDPRSLLP